MSEVECGQWFHEKQTVPPVNLLTWVAVYNILTGVSSV